MAAAALLAGLLLAPEAAHAHKCDRTDNDRREASRVIADLTGEIDAMERAIVEALRLQTGQGWPRQDGDRDRGRRAAGHGQCPVTQACGGHSCRRPAGRRRGFRRGGRR